MSIFVKCVKIKQNYVKKWRVDKQMKNKISVFIIIFVILLGSVGSSLATVGKDTTKSIPISLNGTTTVKTEAKTVELTLHLGQFTGVEENVVLGYEATLEYNKDMFESITVEGLNGWTVTYEESTKVLIGEIATATAKSNTDIMKLTLKLKDNLPSGTQGKVTITKLVLSDGENDFTFNKEVTITVKEETPEKENTTNNTNQNITKNENNTSAIKGNNTNKTTVATTKLPAAGIKNMVTIGITIILVVGVISLIRYKMIQLK